MGNDHSKSPCRSAVRLVDRIRAALRPEILERAQMRAGEFGQAHSLRRELEDLASALGGLAAEEFRDFAQLPAVLALTNGIARSRLCDAPGVVNLDQHPQAVEGKAAFGEEFLKHDCEIRYPVTQAMASRHRSC